MKNKRLFCRILALAMCLLMLLPQSVAQETSLHDQLQKEIEKISKKWDAVGVSAAYVRDGKVVDTIAYGYAERN